MKLSRKQIDFFINSNYSFNIASGAVSSGKTRIQILRWIDFIANEAPEDCLLMMSGKTDQSLYDNVVRDLVKLNKHFIVRKQPLRVEYPIKNIEIACASAHNQESWGRIQGKTVCGWLGDEITQHPESFIKMAQSRCRGYGQIWPKFWTCNPDVPEHYVMKDYIMNPNIDVRTWYFNLDDNPVLSEEYKEELKASYSGVYYDRYINGLWVLAEGMVYDEFDRDMHIVEPFKIPYNWRHFRAIDWGYTNPFVCLWGALDPDGRLYIYDEHYEAKKLISYHADQIKKRDVISLDGKPRELYFESTDADWDAQDNAELRKYNVYTNNAIKEVEVGLQKVKARLKPQKDGKPRLFIMKNCKNVIREMGLYRWQDKKNNKNEKEEPSKVNDHSMDALRYMINRIDRGKIKVSSISAGSLGL